MNRRGEPGKFKFELLEKQETMSQAARLVSRLQRELKMLQNDPPPGVSAWPCDDHVLTHLQAQIHGPQETVYANGLFKLDIQIPDRYPFEPPNVKFITPVYHPNIDNGGRICLDILNLPPKGSWRPSLNLSTVLASIGLLLAEPNPDDGLMGDITAEYKHDRLSFDVKAKNWTELYANSDPIKAELSTPQLQESNEPDQKVSASGIRLDNQVQASSSIAEHMASDSSTSSQSGRVGRSLNKRLALDRSASSLQGDKAVTDKISQDRRPPVRLNQSVSCLPHKTEKPDTHARVDRPSSEGLVLKEVNSKPVTSKVTKPSIASKRTVPSYDEENSVARQRDIYHEMSVGTSIMSCRNMMALEGQPQREIKISEKGNRPSDFFPASLLTSDNSIEEVTKFVTCKATKQLITPKENALSYEEQNPVKRQKPERKDTANEISVVISNSAADASPSSELAKEMPLQVGKSPLSDNQRMLLDDAPQVFKNEKDYGNVMALEGQAHREVISLEKENRPPKNFSASKITSDNVMHQTRDTNEARPVVMSNSSISSSTDVNIVHDCSGPQNVNRCLTSRTKSLKLTRTKVESNYPQSKKVGQTLPAVSSQSIPQYKHQTEFAGNKRRSPITIPDDVSTVVISDSGSDSDISGEDLILSLTQRNLNRRKAGSKS
ncbi:hypothetical protein KP509_07G099900 [Ceratopteris richardii]|uniref:E2 ubiquitin-conjugating enzyme n=1 Tax=Ceratopteris richardii TaxID=49495 RepID=A0A8T2UJS2_CERRI|nr:hypothetical protein KP509_07G099900 [Ceratopteris richardii]